MGVSIVAAGVLVYLYLALVGRQLPEAGYGAFAAYWSITLVVQFGVFFPLEQELARLLQTRADALSALRSAGITALILVLLSVVVVLSASAPLRAALHDEWDLVAAVAALCLVSGIQFLARGMLIGLNRLDVYAGVLTADATLRVILAAAVAAAIREPAETDFAWTLVMSVALVHLPVLAWVRRKVRTLDRSGTEPVPPRRFAGAAAQLLLAALCAQVLLNGAPILIAALAGGTQQAAAGRILAAFTLARIPLFIAVPMQNALLPSLARMVQAGRFRALRRSLLTSDAALIGLGLVGFGVVFVLGPTLVGLVFGSRYAVPRLDLGLMVVGTVAYLGLMLVAQALVACGAHAGAAGTWLFGLVIATAVFLGGPEDLFLRAELAFLLGSAGAWLAGTAVLLVLGRIRRRQEAPEVRTDRG